MAGEAPSSFHDHRPWSMPMEGARRAAFERFQRPSRWPSWMLDAVRTREQPATPEAIDALAEITLPDQDGYPVRLRDLWRNGPAVIVWLRQFGCPFCRAYAVELNRARKRFTQTGVRLVLIGQGTPEDAARFRRHLGIELQTLTDADRVTYLWAGTKLATLDELIGPLVVGRALVRMARQRVMLGHNTADEAQLGGSIVVAPDGRVTFAHISRDASDVAPPAELLRALSLTSPRIRRPSGGHAGTAKTSRTGLKVGAVAAIALLGSTIVSAPAAKAAGPGGLPLGDPGQPTYLDVQGAGPLTTDWTVAHWHGQFTDPTNGVTYGYNMVGADPALNQDVTIPVDLIPIDVIFSKQGNFALRGSDVVGRVVASPIFQNTDWSSTPTVTGVPDSSGAVPLVPGGELSAGNGGVQYLDAIMRSQFNKIGTSYHVRLGRPTVLTPWTLDCSKAGGAAFQNPRGIPYGFCNNYPFDVPWGQWNIDPTHLVLFLSHNIIIGSARGCCVLGWHTAGLAEGPGRSSGSGNGDQSVQTYAVNTYLDPGLYNPTAFPFESNLTVLGHEIAEWADDPFANNVIQPWFSPLPPQNGCDDVIEVGDPVDSIKFSVPGNSYDSGPYADGSWHLQDIAFLPWYARQAPNTTSQVTQTPSALGGRYTFMGDLNPYAAFHQPASSC